MVREKGFSEDRIRSGAEKLKKGLKTGVQGRLDGFFLVVAKPGAKAGDKKGDKKRGSDSKASNNKKKRK